MKKIGVRLGNWLLPDQVMALLDAPDPETMKGKQDLALLAILVACGLRPHEAVELNVSDLQQREGHWAIVDLIAKASHIQTIFLAQQIAIRDALLTVLTLHCFNPHPDKVMMANCAQLVNNLNALLLAHEDKFVATPNFHVFSMSAAAHQGAQAVRTNFSVREIGFARGRDARAF